MFEKICSAFSFFAAGTVWAAAYTGQTETNWSAYDGSYDGVFTDANHWKSSAGFPSDYRYIARFPAEASAQNYTVTFPEGRLENSAPYNVYVSNGGSVTLSGSGSNWIMPGASDSIYPTYPIRFLHGVYQVAEIYLPNNAHSNCLQNLSDFNINFKVGADGKTALLQFSGGIYNFYDPAGFVPPFKPYFVVNAKDNQNYRSAEVLFTDGASSRLPNIDIKANSATNRLTFSGGSHVIGGTLAFPGVSSTGDNSQTRNSIVIVSVTNGANVRVAGTTVVGSLPAQVLKEYVFNVEDSVLSFDSYVQQSTSYSFSKLAFRVCDATLEMNANNNYFTRLANQVFEMMLTNSLFKAGGSFSMGPATDTDAVVVSRLKGFDSYVDWTQKSTKTLSGDAEMLLSDCVFSNKCNFFIGAAKTPGSISRVILSGGKSVSYFNEDFKMSTAATESAFTVSGGVHVVASPVFQIAQAADSKATFTVAGGKFTLSGSASNVRGFAYGSGSSATLNLFGGTFEASRLAVGQGTAKLVADGGTFKALEAGTVISGFSSAEVKEGGLTIDTGGFDITIDQDFTGSGEICITGGGSVTISAGRSVSCGLDVRGSTVLKFAGEATLGSLSVGKDLTVCPLEIPYGVAIDVAGNIDANAFKVSFVGGPYSKADGVSEIFRYGAELSGDTLDGWYISEVTGGVEEGCAVEKAVDSAGKALTIEVRDPLTVTVPVESGKTVVTNLPIYTASGDSLVFDVGNDGAFVASSPVKGDASLVKRGEGTLVLESAANKFVSVTNEAGTIVLRHPDALDGVVVPVSGDGIVYDFASPAHTESSFVVAKAHSNEAIRVGIPSAQVAMPLYDIFNGGIIKEGPGSVSFMMPDRNVRLSVANSTPWKGNKPGDAGFKITQGEVAFRGRTPQIRELVYAYMGLAVGVDEELGFPSPVPPSVVFDHINFEAAAAILNFSQNRANPSAGEPSFVVSNKANVVINRIVCGVDQGVPGSSSARTLFSVDDGSTLQIKTQILHYPDGGELDFRVDNCSTVMVASTSIRSDVDMVYRNGSCLMSVPVAGTNPLGILDLAFAVAPAETTFRFESGSQMRVGSVGQTGDKVSLSTVCKLVFSGGEWNPCSPEHTFAFKGITGSLVVEGEGLVLSPEAGQVWTVGVPVADGDGIAGGLVKRGAGKVVLDAANKAYSGVTSVEGGTLDLNGSTWYRAKLGGGDGEFANGVLSSPEIVLDVEDDGESWVAKAVPVLDASIVSGRVRVDLGRNEDSPLSLPRRSIVVARFSGDAPQVSNWRLYGTGIPSTIAQFRIDQTARTVVADVLQGEAGLMLIVK